MRLWLDRACAFPRALLRYLALSPNATNTFPVIATSPLSGASSLRSWDLVLRALILAAIVAATVLAILPRIYSAAHGIGRFQDDAYYYLVTGANFLRDGFFSFDGRNATNGFHPLWMGLVLAVLRLSGASSPEGQVLMITVLEQALLAVAVGYCVACWLRALGANAFAGPGYLAIVCVLLCPDYVIFEQGMETTLAALLMIVTVHALIDERPRLLGAALALLFLARLDTAVFVAPAILAWSTFASGWTRGRRVATLTPLVAGFAVYTAWNVITTGHAVPISGALKSSFPIPHWEPGHLLEPWTLAQMWGVADELLHRINAIIVGAMIAIGGALLAIARLDARSRGKLGAVLAAALLMLANLLLFQKWEKSIDPRYFALPMTAAMFVCLSALGAAPPARLMRVLPVLSLVGVLGWEIATLAQRLPAELRRDDDPIRDIYRQAAQSLPPDAVVAGTDVGALAFWSGLRVVNLDGVINNYAYQDALRARQLREYLAQQGVTHLATALWDRDQDYTRRPTEPMYRSLIDPRAQRGDAYGQHDFVVYSYLYGVYSDAVPLFQSDEVFRRDVGKDGIADAAYVIYRLRIPEAVPGQSPR